MKNIELSPCSDQKVILLAVKAASVLVEQCNTAMVVLTSTCSEDGHGNHVTACVMSASGSMEPSEARAAAERLRSLADELEQRFAPEGSEN